MARLVGGIWGWVGCGQLEALLKIGSSATFQRGLHDFVVGVLSVDCESEEQKLAGNLRSCWIFKPFLKP